MNQLFDLLIFLVPIYIANAIPVVLGGGMPLDFGLVLPDCERLFGKGKTIRGFIAGVLGGTAAGGLVAMIYVLPFFAGPQQQFIASFVLALGTMTGDAVGSFVKRRAHVDSGRPFVLDTLFFLVMALIFVYPVANGSLYEPFDLAFMLILTVILHPLTNAIANRAGLKKVPW